MISMGLLQVKLFMFLLISSLCSKVSGQTPTCSNNTFFIQYPFKLLQEGQYHHHISPYDLKCNRQGEVVLNLPFSGEFYVRNIDYFKQTIQLYDPGHCLPGRLKNLSLSSSPFVAVSYQNYTFLSCHTESTNSLNFTAISCLSNSTASVVATPVPSMVDEIRNSTGCRVIYSLQIPISPDFENAYNGVDGDLQLAWNNLNSRGNTSTKPGALAIILICAIIISIALLVALFCIGCSLSVIVILDSEEEVNQRCWSYRTRFWERGRIRLYSAQQQPQPSVAEVSFMSSAWQQPPPSTPAAPLEDFSVMSSIQVPEEHAASLDESSSAPGVAAPVHPFDYPSTPWSPSVDADSDDDFSVMYSPEAPSVLAAAHDDEFFPDEELPTEDLIIGGSHCISGPNGDSCPICLGEYKASDRLRLIRICHHCFHADCLEPWMQMKTTCPICRTNVI